MPGHGIARCTFVFCKETVAIWWIPRSLNKHVLICKISVGGYNLDYKLNYISTKRIWFIVVSYILNNVNIIITQIKQ